MASWCLHSFTGIHIIISPTLVRGRTVLVQALVTEENLITQENCGRKRKKIRSLHLQLLQLCQRANDGKRQRAKGKMVPYWDDNTFVSYSSNVFRLLASIICPLPFCLPFAFCPLPFAFSSPSKSHDPAYPFLFRDT